MDLDKLANDMAEGMVPPVSTLAILVDMFKDVESNRLAADKLAASLKAREVLIKRILIEGMKHHETSSLGGEKFICAHHTDDEPQVADWPKFYAHILKTKDFSLLERRPGRAAIKERWQDGNSVPGIVKFPVDKLSFQKVK